MTSLSIIDLTESASKMWTLLRAGHDLVVVEDRAALSDEALQCLVQAGRADGVATASPVPLQSCERVRTYDVHQACPPAASLALPYERLCFVSASAANSVLATVAEHPDQDARSLLRILGEVFVRHGWRHVAAPGVALRWDPGTLTSQGSTAGWNQSSVASLVGPANTALEAHRSWASARIDGIRLAIDGVCLTNDPYTGTQHVVIEVARWMATIRPEATVVLAVRPAVAETVRAVQADSSVEVVTRSTGIDADIVYRPYQMLYARELDFVLGTGRRSLVGQLDMIGFSNPFYHPSEQLFFFARNLQRFLMRTCDGVTFISEFGRDSTFAELPDLDRQRLHVVSCGADPSPRPGTLGSKRTIDATTPFVVCLSSTFWHKNRVHSIATFASMVERHGYDGHLVIGGPEPYFGRSTDAETDLISSLPTDVATRVHRWGHLSDDEKWWLLRHAQAALYPSIVEGFGLVPFEAAAVGTPCFVFAGTAQRELLGSTPAAIDSWDADTWADRVVETVGSADAVAELVDSITVVAEAHTWRRCAERTWNAVDHALAAPRRTVHADDGSSLARIAPSSQRRARGAALRFDAARGLPAVGRRVTRLASRARRPRGS